MDINEPFSNLKISPGVLQGMHSDQQIAFNNVPQIFQGNQKQIPIYCSLHGKQLDFFCFDDQQRICIDCLGAFH